MASTTQDESRRRPLQAYNSFPKPSPTQSPTEPRQRASTVDTPTSPNPASTLRIETENVKPNNAVTALYEGGIDGNNSSKDEEKGGEAQGAPAEVNGETEQEPKTPADFADLPVELVSLCDTFIDSLSAKVHPTPPTVDRLSSLFQDFYVLASQHISTHISILSSRQHIQNSSSSVSSVSSRSKARTGSASARHRSIPDEHNSEHQLLTPEELTERKKARKLLEKKRIALEEAVESRVCQKIYPRIFQHRSTSDEAADQKLRSKTAALSVVGIGLKDLGVDLGFPSEPEKAVEKEREVRERLEGAREEIRAMNDEHTPLEKLTRLKKAHKCIVDTLAEFHPSSSADEILPLLIYTLITSPAEGSSVISNLYFIQRFRSESKIDGEAAYCLTNLEAAITFLETVDLSQLRADEPASGPAKSSRPSTPKTDDNKTTPFHPLAEDSRTQPFPALADATPTQFLSAPKLSPALISPPKSGNSGAEAIPRAQPHSRRLSDLLSPATALGSASKDALLGSADQGLKTIGSSLGQSYGFFVGKLRERQERALDVRIPKTLDDARRLVGAEGGDGRDDDSVSASAASSLMGDRPRDDRLVSLISGRAPQARGRDRSVESARSGAGRKTDNNVRPGLAPVAAATQVAEGIRMLSSSFNPLNKFAAMRAGFSRTAVLTPTIAGNSAGNEEPEAQAQDLTTAFPDLTPVLPPKSPSPVKEEEKIDPPVQRFMDVRSAADLKLGEVEVLLEEYRRVVGALRGRGGFK